MKCVKTFAQRVLLLVVALTMLGVVSADGQRLAYFDKDNFEGWNYSRSSIELNTYNIENRKVNIYSDYMLTSPSFNCANVAYVKVYAKFNCQQYYTGEKYSLTKSSPTFELVDLSGNVVAQKYYQLTEALFYQEMTAYVKVPTGSGDLKLRVSVKNGDANNTGAVVNVEATASNNDGTLKGDVDGNGIVDVSDVTALINIILGSQVTNTRADVDGNGTVDVSDITALINIILS